MARATLGPNGYTMPADSQYNRNTMTSDGRVAPSGDFVAAKVTAISGGTSPQLQIRHGRTPTSPIVRTVSATPGATIDQRASPDGLPNGIYLTMTGAPASFSVEVLFK